MLEISNMIENMGPKNKKIFSRAGLTSTMEDYMEVIYSLSRENEAVRVKDIAKNLRVKMPTVTSMLKRLNEKGMIKYERYESIGLTLKGQEVGKEIDRRHRAISTFLQDILLVERDRADKDACRMEHAISRGTLDRIVSFMEFVETCPRTGRDWFVCFNAHKKDGMQKNKCPADKGDLIFEHCSEKKHK